MMIRSAIASLCWFACSVTSAQPPVASGESDHATNFSSAAAPSMTARDHSTYERPQQLATGVDDVWVNGVEALRNGEATGAASGRAMRGRAWTGAAAGGCRASVRDWTWSR
jgi:hypothetical protein